PHLSCSLSSDPPPTDTYPLSLHDALPISALPWAPASRLPLGLNVRCSYRWSMMSFASLVLALAKGAALGVLELAAVRSLRVWCRLLGYFKRLRGNWRKSPRSFCLGTSSPLHNRACFSGRRSSLERPRVIVIQPTQDLGLRLSPAPFQTQ